MQRTNQIPKPHVYAFDHGTTKKERNVPDRNVSEVNEQVRDPPSAFSSRIKTFYSFPLPLTSSKNLGFSPSPLSNFSRVFRRYLTSPFILIMLGFQIRLMEIKRVSLGSALRCFSFVYLI